LQLKEFTQVIIPNPVTTYSFSGSIAAGVTGSFDLPEVVVGKKNVYTLIVISVADDEAIHEIILTRISDSWVVGEKHFVLGEQLDLANRHLVAGDQIRVQTTNNSDQALTFEGVIHYLTLDM